MLTPLRRLHALVFALSTLASFSNILPKKQATLFQFGYTATSSKEQSRKTLLLSRISRIFLAKQIQVPLNLKLKWLACESTLTLSFSGLDNGVHHSHSLDAQETNIRLYAESQHWELTKFYTDAGISAKKGSHRPALESLLSDAKKGALILSL